MMPRYSSLARWLSAKQAQRAVLKLGELWAAKRRRGEKEREAAARAAAEKAIADTQAQRARDKQQRLHDFKVVRSSFLA